jgi:putative acetyltransferase
MIIRDELPQDAADIGKIIDKAFKSAEHSSGTEARIVERLRAADALTISLVAIHSDRIVGHLAASPVTIGAAQHWYGLGPVAVRPDYQRSGIGSALINRALDRLRADGAAGCVVLGDPTYYSRFGFKHDPELHYADVPPPYFQVVNFTATDRSGAVQYHPAFDEPS